jgi:hypothetical protein
VDQPVFVKPILDNAAGFLRRFPLQRLCEKIKVEMTTMGRLRRKIRHSWHHTRKRRVAGLLLAFFVLINGGVYLVYRERTYPGTTIHGQSVGSLPAGRLAQQIKTLPLLPVQLHLHSELHPKQKASPPNETTDTVAPAAVGMSVDSEQTARALLETRSWLPVFNFFRAPRGTAVITVEPKTYQRQIQDIGRPYKKDAVDARLIQRGGDFIIIPETDAQTIDTPGSQAKIIEALSAGRNEAELVMRASKPKVTRDSLQPTLQDLQAQRATAVTLNYQGKTKHFAPTQIGSWFVQAGESFSLVTGKIANAVADASLELGIRLANAEQAAAAVQTAVSGRKTANIPVTGTALGSKSYSFCTAGRGVPDADVRELGTKTQSVLNSGRGWALDGHVSFWLAAPGGSCDFTIWLASADQMATFGAICDPLWSCTVSPNVIINYDRWRGGTDAWNKDGGNIQDYRTMAINHEVGHWLGFQHSNCPGSGQLAPVMQQQSIDLQGCVFNPWPIATERLALRNYLNL